MRMPGKIISHYLKNLPIVCALILSLATPTLAAKLKPDDLAWIETCAEQRKKEGIRPSALRKYCACMQEIVEDNRPFTVSELEHSYPPAHAMCHRKAGLR